MKIKRPQSPRPIPPDAKRVFKGKIFEAYQWEQELYDGTKTIFEKLARDDSVNPVRDMARKDLGGINIKRGLLLKLVQYHINL